MTHSNLWSKFTKNSIKDCGNGVDMKGLAFKAQLGLLKVQIGKKGKNYIKGAGKI